MIGSRVAELDVVGGGVLERPAGGQRLELDVERQQRGVLELAERPLEGIRDELDLLGPDDRPGVGRRGVGEVRRFVADQAAGLDQAVGQAAGEEGVPVVDRGRADLAVAGPRCGGRRSRRGRDRNRDRGPSPGRPTRSGQSRRRGHRRGLDLLRSPEAVHDATDLGPEEDRDRDDGGDDDLDDQAARPRVDVGEQLGHAPSDVPSADRRPDVSGMVPRHQRTVNRRSAWRAVLRVANAHLG